MCLSSPHTSKVLNSQEKQILHKAGLGMKENQVFSDDVYSNLTGCVQ